MSRSSTTTAKRAARALPPIHPGEQLREEFLKPLGITAYRLAKDLGGPVTRIQDIVAERRAITRDTPLALGRYFRTNPGFWLNIQADFQLGAAADALGQRLDRGLKPPARCHRRTSRVS